MQASPEIVIREFFIFGPLIIFSSVPLSIQGGKNIHDAVGTDHKGL